MKNRISDIISQSEIISWRKEDVIIVDGPTGSGKSHFCKNDLYNYAKFDNSKIKMLVDRSNCKEQFQEEINREGREDLLTVDTYQKIENLNLFGTRNYDFDGCNYIICDEFHYFLSDANFNEKTDISFDAIMGQTNAIKIFMSATPKNMERYIKENVTSYSSEKKINIKRYELPREDNYINELKFFYEDETLEQLINQFIEEGSKAIFFIQSVEKAYTLYEKYKDKCLFNCSKYNKKYYRYVDKKKIKKMLIEEKFEANILITTLCMESGININDENVKNIVLDVFGDEKLVQCSGRKRSKDENDKINLYVRCFNNKQLGGMERKIKYTLKRIEYLKTHTAEDYRKKFPRSAGFERAIYDNEGLDKNNNTKKINQLIEFKYKIDLEEIKEIKSYGKLGYIEYMSKKLGIKDYNLLEDDKKKEEVSEHLYKIKGKILNKEERYKLVELFNTKDSSRRTYKSIGKLNKYLLENNFPYKIIPKIMKNKTYWIITEGN